MSARSRTRAGSCGAPNQAARRRSATARPYCLYGAITVPVSVLIFAETGGRTISVTPWVVTTTAIVGGVVGTITAGTLEYDTLRDLGTVPMVLVGIIEEAAKLIVPFVVYLFVRPKDSRAGVIIGIASGMGFATLETMGYGFQALLSAGSISAVDDTLPSSASGRVVCVAYVS